VLLVSHELSDYFRHNAYPSAKEHIPYRGDNPEVGKKTGIAVQHVERKSDGFEPFDELIQAADGLTPPQRKAMRKSLAAKLLQDEYDDEDGEQSMQIDSG
jgi:centromere protein C